MPRPNPKDQAKLSRKNAIRAGQTRAKRRGIYVLIAIVLIAVVIGGVAWYLYVQGQNSNASTIVDATIYTSKGPITVELYRSQTPKTVANFVNLAKTGFYNNLVWHRIVPSFVIQTGDPNTRGAVNSTRSSWGQGVSSPTVPAEFVSSLHNYAGYLAMARTQDVNSASCQFFINLVDNSSQLDGPNSTNGGYTVFGKVLSGMDIVNALGAVQTYPQSLGPPYASQPVDASQAMMLNVTITSGA